MPQWNILGTVSKTRRHWSRALCHPSNNHRQADKKFPLHYFSSSTLNRRSSAERPNTKDSDTDRTLLQLVVFEQKSLSVTRYTNHAAFLPKEDAATDQDTATLFYSVSLSDGTPVLPGPTLNRYDNELTFSVIDDV